MKGAALVLLAAALLAGCTSDDDRAAARQTTSAFLGAVAAGDGERACAQLSEATAKKLADDEKMPCSAAVTKLDLSDARPVAAEVFVTSAQVRLADGLFAFLDETADGWRISAAGCTPEPGEEAPQSCEVES